MEPIKNASRVSFTLEVLSLCAWLEYELNCATQAVFLTMPIRLPTEEVKNGKKVFVFTFVVCNDNM